MVRFFSNYKYYDNEFYCNSQNILLYLISLLIIIKIKIINILNILNIKGGETSLSYA